MGNKIMKENISLLLYNVFSWSFSVYFAEWLTKVEMFDFWWQYVGVIGVMSIITWLLLLGMKYTKKDDYEK